MALLLMGWPPSAQALNDAQQLVVDAWRLVNQSYVDPERFEEVHWRQLRQQALERRIESSGEAYDAIAAMLAPLEDPYTRFLSPSDYSALRSSTKGSVSGVGLQLGTVGSDQAIVVIAPSMAHRLRKRPSAPAAFCLRWRARAASHSVWKPLRRGCGGRLEAGFRFWCAPPKG